MSPCIHIIPSDPTLIAYEEQVGQKLCSTTATGPFLWIFRTNRYTICRCQQEIVVTSSNVFIFFSPLSCAPIVNPCRHRIFSFSSFSHLLLCVCTRWENTSIPMYHRQTDRETEIRRNGSSAVLLAWDSCLLMLG